MLGQFSDGMLPNTVSALKESNNCTKFEMTSKNADSGPKDGNCWIDGTLLDCDGPQTLLNATVSPLPQIPNCLTTARDQLSQFQVWGATYGLLRQLFHFSLPSCDLLNMELSL